jgi:hypothetical protein
MGWRLLLDSWASIGEYVWLKTVISFPHFAVEKNKGPDPGPKPCSKLLRIGTVKKTAQYPQANAGWHQSMKDTTNRVLRPM